MPANTSSAGVRGATYVSASPPHSGAGRALRSNFPLGVSGNAASVTNAEGIMYWGSDFFRLARTSSTKISAPSFATTYATSRLSPGTSSRTNTSASRTEGWASNAASISPNSIRKPRIFTWKSVRPRNSSSPLLSVRTRSPVLYSREPLRPNGSGTKRSALHSAHLRPYFRVISFRGS